MGNLPIFLLIELLVGSLAGIVVSRQLAPSRVAIVSCMVAYLLIAVGCAVLSWLYPGPDSRYPVDSMGAWLRQWVTKPTSWLWVLGPAVSALAIAAWLRARHAALPVSRSVVWSALLSLLTLPIWIMGLMLHGASAAGAWL